MMRVGAHTACGVYLTECVPASKCELASVSKTLGERYQEVGERLCRPVPQAGKVKSARRVPLSNRVTGCGVKPGAL